MDRLNPPEPLSLSGNVGVAWKKWRQRFRIYMVDSGLDRQPDEIKTSVLLHSIGTDALDVYNTFPLWQQRQNTSLRATSFHHIYPLDNV